MVLNIEKRRQLAVVEAQLKTASGPSVSGPSAPAPVDQRLKGVAEVTEVAASKDEDTCSGLIFKRKRKADVVVLAPLGSEGQATPYREHPPNASSPCDIVVQEGRGRVPREVTSGTPTPMYHPSSKKHCTPSKLKQGWKAWKRTPCWIMCRGILGRSSWGPAFSSPKCRRQGRKTFSRSRSSNADQPIWPWRWMSFVKPIEIQRRSCLRSLKKS